MQSNTLRLTVLSIACAMLIISQLALVAKADYQDGFDLDASGTVNPTACPNYCSTAWTFSTSTSQCFSGQVQNAYTPSSNPNVYAFLVSGTSCAFGENEQISDTLTAANTFVNVQFFYLTHGSPPASTFYMQLCLNPSKSTTCSTSQPNAEYCQYDVSTASSYTKCAGTVPTTPGLPVTVIIQMYESASDSASFGVGIDNVTITGASGVTAGYDFQMIDWSSQQWFNIVGFKNSRLYVTYSNNNPPLVIQNLTVPDYNLPLTGATLVTVWVGNSYERTIIPSGTTTMYLNQPASVSPYTFNIEDLTGNFPSGTMVSIQSGSFVITSGYTDAADTFSTFLEPGPYNIVLTNGVNTYTQIVSLGSVSTINIQILKVKISNAAGLITATGFVAGWDNTEKDIVTVYNDNTSSTTLLDYYLLLSNSSGTYTVVSQGYTSGVSGFFENAVPANVNYSSEYFVKLIVNNVFGSGQILGPKPVSGGQVFALPLSLPPQLLGLNLIIPAANAWESLIGLIFVVSAGSVFGARSSKYGFLVAGILTGVLTAAGWFTLPVGLPVTFVVLAVTALLVESERRSAYA